MEYLIICEYVISFLLSSDLHELQNIFPLSGHRSSAMNSAYQ